VLLTRLGVPKLWDEDPEVLWHYMRYFVAPPTMWLAPSYGYGVERVPLSGGAVIAANHLSAIDHPLIGLFCPRAVYYMAKAELLAMPIVGEMLMWAGTFPVRRAEQDLEALRTARRAVRNGHVLGMHIEGTRQRLGYPGEARPGAAIIAIQEGVPLIPCGVETFGWSPTNRRRCSLVWGKPLPTDAFARTRQGYAEGTETVRSEVVRLWRQAAEARVAGFPLELPDGTRRSRAIRPGEDAVAAARPERD
jgi:1-acyl-sn-glycerol-3-phosphate acyltransferase